MNVLYANKLIIDYFEKQNGVWKEIQPAKTFQSQYKIWSKYVKSKKCRPTIEKRKQKRLEIRISTKERSKKIVEAFVLSKFFIELRNLSMIGSKRLQKNNCHLNASLQEWRRKREMLEQNTGDNKKKSWNIRKHQKTIREIN